ncbi:MAG TPA: sodium:proton antiporter [Cellvibrionaceae bacterium]|nr:sodium:proton antiporter [Cellvibrionaceae bacterium]
MSSIATAKLDLFYLSIVILTGISGSVIAKKIKVPDIVFFLILGIAIGPAAFNLLNIPADSTLNQLILTLGACYLLFEGGATLKFAVLKEIWVTLLIIATLGVLITCAITSGFALAFGLPLGVALLIGAITASTDPATLVPIFKQVPIKDRVAQTVMSESALNDAMGAILTFTVVGFVVGGSEALQPLHIIKELFWEAGGGILIGASLGYVTAILMAHAALGIFRSHLPFLIVLAVIITFLVADQLHASGFMAVFTCGVIVGNKEFFRLPLDHHEHEYLEDYMGNTALLMRMFIFILLGSQVDFTLLGQYLWVGVALLVIFMCVARPLTVLLCAAPDRRAKWSWQELVFMSWTRETGVIPAALVGMLSGMQVPGIDVAGAITFIFILGTILIQAPTTALLAGRLGLLLEEPNKQPLPHTEQTQVDLTSSAQTHSAPIINPATK